MQNAPPALLQTLKQHVGDIAAPDEEFRATDVVVNEQLPNRRIMFIWNTGSRWVVATELGGYGYSNPIFAFELTDDNRRAALVQEITVGHDSAFRETICSIVSDLTRPRRRPPE